MPTFRSNSQPANSQPANPQPANPRPVLKFGGAALVDGPRVRRACGLVARVAHEHPVVVVSAPGGVTALLGEVAAAAAAGRREGERVRIRLRTLTRQLGIESELLDRQLGPLFRVLDAVAERGVLDPAARDFALSVGERTSARIVARALREAGLDAAPVDAFDLGLVSDSNHGRARPVAAALGGLRAALEAVPGVPVVTGFLAADSSGNVTTLGPNGSDWTAALVAEAIGADRVEFWKPVAGVFSADPAEVPEARLLPRLGFQQAAALARAGAGVLHPDALQPLRRAGIPAVLRGFEEPDAPGTTLGPEELPGPVGVALLRGVHRWTLEGPRCTGWTAVAAARGHEPREVEVEPGRVRLWLEAPADVPGEADACEGPFALVSLVSCDGALGREALAAAEREVEVFAAWLGGARDSQVIAVREADARSALRAWHQLVLSGPGACGISTPAGTRAG